MYFCSQVFIMVFCVILIVMFSTASLHCRRKFSGEDTTKVVPKVGYLESNPPNNLLEAPLTLPAPCGSSYINYKASEQFYPTAIQIYHFDPSMYPATTILIESVEIETTCRQFWVLHNQYSRKELHPVPLSAMPSYSVEILTEKLRSEMDSLEVNQPNYELLDQEEYDCPYLSLSGTKKLKVFKYTRVFGSWSPSGELLRPLLNRNCSLFSQTLMCDLESSKLLIWKDNISPGLALTPLATLVGLLELKDTNQANRCPRVSRFISSNQEFQLSLGGVRADSLAVLQWIHGIPIFLSLEGHLFSFANHQGEPVFGEFCPNWFSSLKKLGKFKRGVNLENRSKRSPYAGSSLSFPYDPDLPKFPRIQENNQTRPRREIPRSIVDFPEEFRSLLLAEKSAWSISEVMGQIGDLSNRTSREILDLQLHSCQRRVIFAELALSILPISEIPYMNLFLGHRLYRSFFEKGRVLYYLARPIDSLSFSENSIVDGRVKVNFTIKGATMQGYLQCGSGIITSDPIKSPPHLSECYLPLLKLGAVDLCSGQFVKTINPLPDGLNAWEPKLHLPTPAVKNPNYKLSLVRWSSLTDSIDNSEGSNLNKFLLPSSLFSSLTTYIHAIDYLILSIPYVIGFLFFYWCCCSISSRTTIRSTLY